MQFLLTANHEWLTANVVVEEIIMFLKQSVNLGDSEISIETGRIAKQADGAAKHALMRQ